MPACLPACLLAPSGALQSAALVTGAPPPSLLRSSTAGRRRQRDPWRGAGNGGGWARRGWAHATVVGGGLERARAAAPLSLQVGGSAARARAENGDGKARKTNANRPPQKCRGRGGQGRRHRMQRQGSRSLACRRGWPEIGSGGERSAGGRADSQCSKQGR